MENIYDRIEKIRLQFMKIMPRMKPKMMFGDVDNPIANLTISEVKILHLFKGNERYKMSELAKACGMPLPTATHVVDKLVKNNIVKRTPDKKDRRVIFIEFTEQGRKVMTVCDAQHKENVKNMISILDKQDQERLISALEKFAFVIEEISDKMDKKRKEKEGVK
ncbi:MAG: MarR family transcriptional regulator [Candidatus Firestonebacteria bacterium]